jgi:hypothetical protein
MFASLRKKCSNYQTCLLRFLNSFTINMYWSVLLFEVSATGLELNVDVSALQRSVLLLEVSATEPELHLDVSALQRSVLLLEVSATGPELNLDVSALRRYVSNPQGPVHTYCRTCSLHFKTNFLIIERVRFASKIIFLLSKVFALLRK